MPLTVKPRGGEAVGVVEEGRGLAAGGDGDGGAAAESGGRGGDGDGPRAGGRGRVQSGLADRAARGAGDGPNEGGWGGQGVAELVVGDGGELLAGAVGRVAAPGVTTTAVSVRLTATVTELVTDRPAASRMVAWKV